MDLHLEISPRAANGTEEVLTHALTVPDHAHDADNEARRYAKNVSRYFCYASA